MPVELIVGAAVGAAVASPTIRQKVRRGVVLGLAGVLVAYDKMAKVTHAVAHEVSRETPPADGASKSAPAPGANATPSPAQPAATTSG
jgi:hypothetical protein